MKHMDQVVPFSAYRMGLSVAFPTVLLLGTLLGARTIEIGPVIVPGGAPIFPLTFSILVIMAEVYGLTPAFLLAKQGAGVLIATILLFAAVDTLPGDPRATVQAHDFHILFGQTPRLSVGVLVGFTTGLLATSFVADQIARRTEGRLLALRIWLAPMFAGLLTTWIALPIVLIGTPGQSILPRLLIDRTVYGVIYSTVTVPLVVWTIYEIRQRESPAPLPDARFPELSRMDHHDAAPAE